MKYEYLDRVRIGKHGKVMEVAQSFPIGQVAIVQAPNGTRYVADWDELTMVSAYPRPEPPKTSHASLTALAYFPLAA